MVESPLMGELGRLASEAANPASADIDLLPTAAMLERINAEDARVAPAVAAVLPQIAQAVEAIAAALRAGGRLVYVGAGTSGRLGVLDASECPPTFSTAPGQVLGLIAGGDRALRTAVEGAEDDPAAGAAAVEGAGVGGRDVVVGIAASGRTPFVLGALRAARAAGAVTVALTCNPGSALAAEAGIEIAPPVGPEVIAGSTRMKAGTAQKLVLNMLSTGAMIRLGRVHGNLMVELQATNAKLTARAARIVMAATGCDAGTAQAILADTGGEVKLAILMLLTGLEEEPAREALAGAGGVLRRALADTAPG